MRPDEALNWARNSVRMAIKESIKVTPNTMMVTARVLSPPVPLSNEQVRSFFGDIDPAATNPSATATDNVVNRFQFKARIIENAPWNSHLRLPDPCSIDTAPDELLASISSTIRDHITLISPAGYTGKIPKIGDYILARLDQIQQPGSTTSSWNMAVGFFVEIVDGSVRSSATPDINSSDCASLAQSFQGGELVADASSMSSIYAPGTIPEGRGATELTTEKPAIISACEAKGYTMFSDGKLNLIGVRSAISRDSDTFNDMFFTCWKTGDMWETRSYPITTKPAQVILLRPKWPDDQGESAKGAAILKPGHYQAWVLDTHGSNPDYAYEALAQRAAPVTIFRDRNRNTTWDQDTATSDVDESTGIYGINIHRANASYVAGHISFRVGTDREGAFSEGCQVFPNSEDFAEVMQLCYAKKDQMPKVNCWIKNGGDGNYPAFTYTLLTYEDYDVSTFGNSATTTATE